MRPGISTRGSATKTTSREASSLLKRCNNKERVRCAALEQRPRSAPSYRYSSHDHGDSSATSHPRYSDSLHASSSHTRFHMAGHQFHADAECNGVSRADIEVANSSSRVCRLDSKADPVDVMQQLRTYLLNSGSCILTIDSRPAILLDAVAVLHLLNQDLRLERNYYTGIFFQPMLAGTNTDDWATPYSSHNNRISRDSSSSMSLLITLAAAPELLQPSRPCVIGQASKATVAASLPGRGSTAVQQTSSSGVWDLARMLVAKLNARIATQLRCEGPRGLVAAFRSLRHARKLVTLAGDSDLLVYPHIDTEHGIPTICLNCWHKNVMDKAEYAAVAKLEATARATVE